MYSKALERSRLSALAAGTLLLSGVAQAGDSLHGRADISVTGVRVTQGDAVDCPRLRDAEGVLHAVSHLSPRVAIGALVEVTGSYQVTTRCVGRVIAVREERLIEK